LPRTARKPFRGQEILEGRNRVVGVPHQEAVPLQARLGRLREPSIQHVVQVDVREERRDDPALGRAAGRAAQGTRFEHPRPQPFVDHPPDDAVRDALVKEVPQVRMVDGVEVLRDVDVHHPAQPLPDVHEAVAEVPQRVVGRAPRPKAVRARQEIRLVDRLQQEQDRPLRHLVFPPSSVL
jgi:hypothetical protein